MNFAEYHEINCKRASASRNPGNARYIRELGRQLMKLEQDYFEEIGRVDMAAFEAAYWKFTEAA